MKGLLFAVLAGLTAVACASGKADSSVYRVDPDIPCLRRNNNPAPTRNHPDK